MKRIAILVMGVVLLMATSCEKEETMLLKEESKSKSVTNKASGDDDVKYKLRMFWDEPMLPTGCVPREVDCFPFDIVVTPNQAGPLNDLFQAIDGEVPGITQAEFQHHRTFLIDLLSTGITTDEATGLIDEVIAGTLTAGAVYDEEDNQRFIILHQPGNTEPYFVLPFNE